MTHPHSPPVHQVFPPNNKDGRPVYDFHIQTHLNQLGIFADDFFYAVALFDLCETNLARPPSPGTKPLDIHGANRCHGWMEMAGRDGAMSIFHFAKSLDGLKSVTADARETCSVDHDAFRAQRRRFREHFPQFGNMRHSVAHAGEIQKTRRTRDKHLLQGSAKVGGVTIESSRNVSFQNLLSGRLFSNVYEGQPYTYEVTWDNWAVLEGVASDLIALFQKT